MDEQKQSSFGSFLKGYRERTIESNSETLRMYSDEIKYLCSKVGVDSSKYENLQSIKKDEDIGKWVAFGEYLTNQISLGKIEINESLRDLAYNYAKMSLIPDQAYLNSSAEGLAKVVLDSKISQRS